MNFGGGNDNRTFRTGALQKDPYYYINASIDLTGLHTGAIVETDPYIFYFNKENNFNYLNSNLYPNVDEYGNYHIITEHDVIGEVTVYVNPSVIYEGLLDDLIFEIGGVYKPSIALRQDLSPADLSIAHSVDVWGGPTGNVPGPLTVQEVEDAQVCYYGREPADPAPNPDNDAGLAFGSRKYLALHFVPIQPIITNSEEQRTRSIRPIPRKYRPKARPVANHVVQKPKLIVRDRQVQFQQDPLIESGKMHVVVKVYPKKTS